jgi:hypothetical protein
MHFYLDTLTPFESLESLSDQKLLRSCSVASSANTETYSHSKKQAKMRVFGHGVDGEGPSALVKGVIQKVVIF